MSNPGMTNIKISRVKQFCSPLNSRLYPWGVSVSKLQVTEALKEERLVKVPGTFDHAGRIAWFVIKGEGYDDPIEIDIGCPSIPGYCWTWPITDGNHRLAASIYARRPFIKAYLNGEVAYLERMFHIIL